MRISEYFQALDPAEEPSFLTRNPIDYLSDSRNFHSSDEDVREATANQRAHDEYVQRDIARAKREATTRTNQPTPTFLQAASASPEMVYRGIMGEMAGKGGQATSGVWNKDGSFSYDYDVRPIQEAALDNFITGLLQQAPNAAMDAMSLGMASPPKSPSLSPAMASTRRTPLQSSFMRQSPIASNVMMNEAFGSSPLIEELKSAGIPGTEESGRFTVNPKGLFDIDKKGFFGFGTGFNKAFPYTYDSNRQKISTRNQIIRALNGLNNELNSRTLTLNSPVFSWLNNGSIYPSYNKPLLGAAPKNWDLQHSIDNPYTNELVEVLREMRKQAGK